MSTVNLKETKALPGLDAWEEDVLLRYPDPEAIATAKTTGEYRNYDHPCKG